MSLAGTRYARVTIGSLAFDFFDGLSVPVHKVEKIPTNDICYRGVIFHENLLVFVEIQNYLVQSAFEPYAVSQKSVSILAGEAKT